MPLSLPSVKHFAYQALDKQKLIISRPIVLTLSSPLLYASSDQAERASLHRGGQDGVELLLLQKHHHNTSRQTRQAA